MNLFARYLFNGGDDCLLEWVVITEVGFCWPAVYHTRCQHGGVLTGTVLHQRGWFQPRNRGCFPGSFTGGAEALQEVLTELEVWRKGAIIQDGSGLSRGTMITASMLATAWHTIASTPKLRALLMATPVAGVSGTLRDRYHVDESLGGRGRVHAKTGTLSEVSSLSGWTITRSRQSLIVVLLVNKSKDDWWARAWIDAVSGRISECGC